MNVISNYLIHIKLCWPERQILDLKIGRWSEPQHLCLHEIKCTVIWCLSPAQKQNKRNTSIGHILPYYENNFMVDVIIGV